ncbi:hypothetical protein ACLOJK_014990 [Asimina triloba]
MGTLLEHRFQCSIFPKSANPAAIEDPSPAALQSDPFGSDPTMVRDHSNAGPCKNLTDKSAASIGGQRPTTVQNLHGSFISKSWTSSSGGQMKAVVQQPTSDRVRQRSPSAARPKSSSDGRSETRTTHHAQNA